VATKPKVSRHGPWCRTPTCRATPHGAALTDVGPALPTWLTSPRHFQWRRTPFCRDIMNGTAKKGYSSEKNSPKVYFLKLFQVWVIFI
jgi:hypothetical protein